MSVLLFEVHAARSCLCRALFSSPRHVLATTLTGLKHFFTGSPRDSLLLYFQFLYYLEIYFQCFTRIIDSLLDYLSLSLAFKVN